MECISSVCEWEIYERVYEIYLPAPRASRQAGGLTAEEIRIVEGATQSKGGGM